MQAPLQIASDYGFSYLSWVLSSFRQLPHFDPQPPSSYKLITINMKNTIVVIVGLSILGILITIAIALQLWRCYVMRPIKRRRRSRLRLRITSGAVDPLTFNPPPATQNSTSHVELQVISPIPTSSVIDISSARLGLKDQEVWGCGEVV